jgi:hypothetical protein
VHILLHTSHSHTSTMAITARVSTTRRTAKVRFEMIKHAKTWRV